MAKEQYIKRECLVSPHPVSEFRKRKKDDRKPSKALLKNICHLFFQRALLFYSLRLVLFSPNLFWFVLIFLNLNSIIFFTSRCPSLSILLSFFCYLFICLLSLSDFTISVFPHSMIDLILRFSHFRLFFAFLLVFIPMLSLFVIFCFFYIYIYIYISLSLSLPLNVSVSLSLSPLCFPFPFSIFCCLLVYFLICSISLSLSHVSLSVILFVHNLMLSANFLSNGVFMFSALDFGMRI